MAHLFGKMSRCSAFVLTKRGSSPRADSVTGHVIGLKHEHQRPDAGLHVKFDCRALDGWFAARVRVGAPGLIHAEPEFEYDMSATNRMNKV